MANLNEPTWSSPFDAQKLHVDVGGSARPRTAFDTTDIENHVLDEQLKYVSTLPPAEREAALDELRMDFARDANGELMPTLFSPAINALRPHIERMRSMGLTSVSDMGHYLQDHDAEIEISLPAGRVDQSDPSMEHNTIQLSELLDTAVRIGRWYVEMFGFQLKFLASSMGEYQSEAEHLGELFTRKAASRNTLEDLEGMVKSGVASSIEELRERHHTSTGLSPEQALEAAMFLDPIAYAHKDKSHKTDTYGSLEWLHNDDAADAASRFFSFDFQALGDVVTRNGKTMTRFEHLLDIVNELE